MGIQPLLHLYGHAHSGYGIVVDRKRNIHYVNAASVNFQRKPVHSPIVLRVSKGKEEKLSVEVMNEEKESLFRENADQKKVDEDDELKCKYAVFTKESQCINAIISHSLSLSLHIASPRILSFWISTSHIMLFSRVKKKKK